MTPGNEEQWTISVRHDERHIDRFVEVFAEFCRGRQSLGRRRCEGVRAGREWPTPAIRSSVADAEPRERPALGTTARRPGAARATARGEARSANLLPANGPRSPSPVRWRATTRPKCVEQRDPRAAVAHRVDDAGRRVTAEVGHPVVGEGDLASPGAIDGDPESCGCTVVMTA